MNTKERIEAFNRNNAPFYIVAHDNGRFSLCLSLINDYGQFAFNRYAEQIGESVSENGLHNHGRGYEWETVFRKVFEGDPRLTHLSFDCEAGGFSCNTEHLSLLTDFGQRFRELCEDQERFSDLVCNALQEEERLPEQSPNPQTEGIISLQLSCYSNPYNRTYHADITLPIDQAGYEDTLHRLRCTAPESSEIQIAVESCIFPVLYYLSPPGTLLEYNAFAKRLEAFPEQEQRSFYSTLKTFLYQVPGASMQELINLTYAIDPVSVITNVKNDTELGRFAMEHNLNEDASAVPESSRYLLDLRKIGESYREKTKGRFSGSNYYVWKEDHLPEVYDGKTLPDELLPEKTPFKLYDDGSISSPISPLNQVPCRTFEGEAELREIEQCWNGMNTVQQITCKAILEAEKPSGLRDALYLMKNIYHFKVSLSSDHDEEFAKLFLQYNLPFFLDEKIFEHLSLYDLGTEILHQMNVTMTRYGAVSEYGGSLYEGGRNPLEHKYLKYDLIEICGQKALFSNEKLYNRDIPEGLYCYDIRTDNNGKLCTLEANVYVNHGGSVILKEPIDFGEVGYIEFDGQTAPSFLGETIPVDQFVNRVFDEEGLNNGVSSVNTPSEEYTKEDGFGEMKL